MKSHHQVATRKSPKQRNGGISMREVLRNVYWNIFLTQMNSDGPSPRSLQSMPLHLSLTSHSVPQEALSKPFLTLEMHSQTSGAVRRMISCWIPLPSDGGLRYSLKQWELQNSSQEVQPLRRDASPRWRRKGFQNEAYWSWQVNVTIVNSHAMTLSLKSIVKDLVPNPLGCLYGSSWWGFPILCWCIPGKAPPARAPAPLRLGCEWVHLKRIT